MSIGEELEKLRDDIVHYLCDSVFAMKTCLFKRLVGSGRFRIGDKRHGLLEEERQKIDL